MLTPPPSTRRKSEEDLLTPPSHTTRKQLAILDTPPARKIHKTVQEGALLHLRKKLITQVWNSCKEVLRNIMIVILIKNRWWHLQPGALLSVHCVWVRVLVEYLLPLQYGFLESAGLLFSPSSLRKKAQESEETRRTHATLQDWIYCQQLNVIQFIKNFQFGRALDWARPEKRQLQHCNGGFELLDIDSRFCFVIIDIWKFNLFIGRISGHRWASVEALSGRGGARER